MSSVRHCLLACLCGLTWLVAPLTQAAAGATYGVGVLELTLVDPVEGGMMPAIVFYPTAAPAGARTMRGPYSLDAVPEAAAADGTYPLIVHSHGTGGSHLGHHDTLEVLARAGFVAAAVEHPRDNYRDTSGFATDLQLLGRPHHIVALIDGLLAHAKLGPLIDAARIGMAGFSAGGYTALLVAGAVPNFDLMQEYRRAVPNDPLRARADAATKAGRRKPDLKTVADPRVKAIVVLAPALGYVFDRAGLATVQVPVRVYRPSADQVLVHPWNAERVVRLLPSRPEYQVIERAGHFVFLAPCSPMLAALVRAICTDPPKVDRAAIHARVNAEMVDFFRRTLPAR